MTIMGMSASQARFLGLTARKSNTEYQGQQINQERTALANESANLYNQMLELTVPTPPSTNEFYTTEYVLDNSQEDYSTGDWRISNAVKTYSAENQYEVTLTHDIETRKGRTAIYSPQPKSTDSEGVTLLKFANKGYIQSVKYKEDEMNPYKTSYKSVALEKTTEDEKHYYALSNEDIKNSKITGLFKGFDDFYKENKDDVNADGCYFTLDNEGNTIWHKMSDLKEGETTECPYEVKSNTLEVADISFYQLSQENINSDEFPKPTGFDEWLKFLDEEASQSIKQNGCYFYKDKNGDFNFVTNEDFQKLEIGNPNDSVYIGSSYTYTTPYSTKVTAIIETSKSTGRYSSISISDNDDYPPTLQNKTFTVSTQRVFDEQAYNDAYHDYEYQKDQYEKSITDLNSKTEVVQKEDQGLELKLQQLDTEQKAISTEIDSVTKVIEDNIDKTFKTFA